MNLQLRSERAIKLPRHKILFILLLLLIVGLPGNFIWQRQSIYGKYYRSEGGFRGLKWGAPSSELVGLKLAYHKQFANFSRSYRKTGEWLRLGHVPLKYVDYQFALYKGSDREIFYEVWIDFAGPPGKYEAQILDVLTRQYGQYIKKDTRDTPYEFEDNSEFYEFEDKFVVVAYWPARFPEFGEHLEIRSKEMTPVLRKAVKSFRGEGLNWPSDF